MQNPAFTGVKPFCLKMKKTLKQIINSGKILGASSLAALAIAFSGCGTDDEEDYSSPVVSTNSPAATNSVPSTPAEPEEPEQYVAPNTKDIRGTWYSPGNSGGWYGPYNEWGFGWYYFEQYGEDIRGKCEYELYQQGWGYDYLNDVRGKITGDRLYLLEYDYEGNIMFKINANVGGGEIEGTETIASGEYQGSTSDFYLKQTSSEIDRRNTPWD